LRDTIGLAEQDLARTITEQYITTYGDQIAVDFSAEILTLLRKEDTILKKLTQASVYKQTDYLSFYVTLQAQELAYLQAQIQYDADYLTLGYIAGVADTTVERVSKPEIDALTQFDFYQTVFYRRYITDSLRVRNQKMLIDYEYKPRIGAYVDAGYQSTLMEQIHKNFGTSAGISVNIPLYDNHQKELRYQKLDIQERTRQYNLSYAFNQYNQQVALLNRQLSGIDAVVDRINLQVQYVHTLFNANERLLQTGDVKITDHVLAINNYLTARNLLNQNFVSRLRLLNQLKYWNR